MMRDIPSRITSASRFNSLHNLATMHRSGSSKSGLNAQAGVAGVSSSKDDLLPYESKLGRGKDRKATSEIVQCEERRVTIAKKAKRLQDLPHMEQKWIATHGQTILAKDLRPQRLPLQSKRTKRCHVCRHIVVKVNPRMIKGPRVHQAYAAIQPDPKAASTKYKICLVATTYLPQIVSPSIL
jgi:dynactin-4